MVTATQLSLHPLVRRQLQRLGSSVEQLARQEGWPELLAMISSAYTDADVERQRMERMLEISSSEMMQLHERLGEERNKLEAMVSAIADGLAWLDDQGRLGFVNPAGLVLLGASSSALFGRPLTEHIAAPANAGEELLRAISEARPLRLHDALFRRADGGTFPVAFTVSPCSHGAVILFRDLTEQHQLEVSLRHAQKLESVGRLAAGIAHEINTPIQFIGDNLEFLRTAFSDLAELVRYADTLMEARVDAETREALRKAREDADLDYMLQQAPPAITNSLEGVARVSKIVQAMKALAHQDRGQRTLADLNRALEDTLNVSRNEYKYVADVELDLGHLPPVSCFLNDLSQVFLNLIINAAHAVADKVGDSGARGKIQVQSRADGDFVEVSICDSGTGIPEHVRAHIFEPFFTTKEVGRGTGQGLALARAIVVDKHKGTLSFDSRVGEGTCFKVRIPCHVEAS